MNRLKQLSTTIPGLLISAWVWAQDKKVDVDIDINKQSNHEWYQQPWVWVIGGAIFILLLVALMRKRD